MEKDNLKNLAMTATLKLAVTLPAKEKQQDGLAQEEAIPQLTFVLPYAGTGFD